jgi:hypothetical protein
MRRETAAEIAHIGVVVPFGEAATVWGGQERKMSEFWNVIAQLLI